MEREIWIKDFQTALLLWYDKNKRVLPWRDIPTPYRVWVSEIMLQQTRVDTVKPYFERFVAELPDVKALAEVSEQKLLKLWEGLGYYSRVKNMQRAAKTVMEQGGGFPSTYAELLKLSGIGKYSAGAIASIAYGEKVCAVDGNVLRVLSRITENYGDILCPSVKLEIENIVKELLPNSRVGDFNQALMELGACVCLPNGFPKCELCPMSFLCLAFQKNVQALIPVKKSKADKTEEFKMVFLIFHGDKVAIRKRSDSGLLAGLWEFPSSEGHLTLENAEKLLASWGIAVKNIEKSQPSKHIFTHKIWHMTGVTVVTENEVSDFVWTTREKIAEDYPIATAFKTYSNILKKR